MQLEMEADRSDVIGHYESAGTERIGEVSVLNRFISIRYCR